LRIADFELAKLFDVPRFDHIIVHPQGKALHALATRKIGPRVFAASRAFIGLYARLAQ
jgi:hypothetical protein